MCVSLATMAAIGSLIGTAGTLTGVLGGKKTPQVVQQSPAIDSTAADTASAQAAAAAKLNQRRAARANSLLSAAGAAGDPLTQAGVATGKTALGQ